MTTAVGTESTLESLLEDLIQLDYDAADAYQAALDRFVREYAAVERIDETTATERVEQMLSA